MTCNLCHNPVDCGADFLCLKDGLEILKCKVCGLVFRAKMPDDQELKQIYSDEYFFCEKGDTKGQGYLDYLKDEAFLRVNFRRRVTRIGRVKNPPGKLLDIGCAAGFFLDEARKQGWEPEGVELSQTMADWGRVELGLDIWTGKFQDYDARQNTYDLVTMWDYIEHSIDPARDFKKVYDMTKPGGIIAVTTGNIHSVVAKISGTRWHLLTPRHHLFYFSPNTMYKYLEGNGFRVLSLTSHADVYSVRYLIHKLYTITPFSPIRRLTKVIDKNGIGKIKLPVNLFDIMTTYGQKV